MGFNLEEYETVAERLKRWWEAYPDGSIITTMVHYDGKTVVFRAEGFGAGLFDRHSGANRRTIKRSRRND